MPTFDTRHLWSHESEDTPHLFMYHYFCVVFVLLFIINDGFLSLKFKIV